MTYSHLTRRRFLNGIVGAGALYAIPLPALAAVGGVREFTLKAQASTASILPPQYGDTPVWSYNGEIPGTVLRAKQGERVRIHFENALTEPTTVHWHGLRIPIDMDGVPDISQKPVPPGEMFTYEFTVPDAGTYWYHPHVNTSEQMGRGLSGVFIVEEANPPQVDREELWVLDDWRLNNDATISDFGQGMDISHGGRHGNVVTVNGKLPGEFNVRSGERIRVRIANVCNAKFFVLRIEGHDPKVISYDGHPVEPHSSPNGQLVLGPGQRADLILDCLGKPADTFSVIDDVDPSQPYRMIDGIYGAALPLTNRTLGPVEALADNPLSEVDLNAALRHEIVIEGGAMGGMPGAQFEGAYWPTRELVQFGRIWALNGVAAHTTAMDPIFTVKRGATVVVTVKNNTAFPHPMHLHGHAFRILKIDGVDEPLRPWADTVLLMPQGGSAKIAFVADNPGDWLFHCHVLEHVSGGMTSVIRVS